MPDVLVSLQEDTGLRASPTIVPNHKQASDNKPVASSRLHAVYNVYNVCRNLDQSPSP
jgi:hypothetical protein